VRLGITHETFRCEAAKGKTNSTSREDNKDKLGKMGIPLLGRQHWRNLHRGGCDKMVKGVSLRVKTNVCDMQKLPQREGYTLIRFNRSKNERSGQERCGEEKIRDAKGGGASCNERERRGMT